MPTDKHVPSTITALRVRFIETALRKNLDRLRQTHASKAPVLEHAEREAQTWGEIITNLETIAACGFMQLALNQATQTLSDNWNNLPEDARNSFQDSIAQALGDYENLC